MVRFILVCSLLLAGCDWSPERGNPYDPNSDRYVPPPVVNRAPFVERPSVTTHCVNNPLVAQCGFAIETRISDLDNNLSLDSVKAFVDGRFLGALSYQPDSVSWVFKREESELDSATERFVGAWVSVIATDDSGASHKDSVQFPRLFNEYPEIRYPEDYGPPEGDCICEEFHTFIWQRWNGEGQAQYMELQFYFQNRNYLPTLTLSGVSAADTSVVVPLVFETADNNSFVFYGWRLFVVDQYGSTAGSQSGTFHAFENCPDDSCHRDD